MQEISETDRHLTGRNVRASPRELFAEFADWCTNTVRASNIPFYAAQLHASPHHLSAVIKKTGGNSVMFWVNRATVQAAKILLNTKGNDELRGGRRRNFPELVASPAFSRAKPA